MGWGGHVYASVSSVTSDPETNKMNDGSRLDRLVFVPVRCRQTCRDDTYLALRLQFPWQQYS